MCTMGVTGVFSCNYVGYASALSGTSRKASTVTVTVYVCMEKDLLRRAHELEGGDPDDKKKVTRVSAFQSTIFKMNTTIY